MLNTKSVLQYVIFGVILVALCLFAKFSISIFSVSGDSMFPFFSDGDVVLMTKACFKKKNGDIVAFKSDYDNLSIKRIYGIYGDTILISNTRIELRGKKNHIDNLIHAYDSRFNLEFTENTFTNNRSSFTFNIGHQNVPADYQYNEKIVVPRNHFYLIGDNLNESLDSRHYGTIYKDKIKGYYICRLTNIKDLNAYCH